MAEKKECDAKENQEIEPVHFILLVVADALLLISGLAAFFFTNFSLNLIKKAIPDTSLNIVNLTLISVAWIVLAYILFVNIYNLKQKVTKDWIWFTLILGIIVVLTANIIPGILIIVSAVMQIIKDIKLNRYTKV